MKKFFLILIAIIALSSFPIIAQSTLSVETGASISLGQGLLVPTCPPLGSGDTAYISSTAEINVLPNAFVLAGGTLAGNILVDAKSSSSYLFFGLEGKFGNLTTGVVAGFNPFFSARYFDSVKIFGRYSVSW